MTLYDIMSYHHIILILYHTRSSYTLLYYIQLYCILMNLMELYRTESYSSISCYRVSYHVKLDHNQHYLCQHFMLCHNNIANHDILCHCIFTVLYCTRFGEKTTIYHNQFQLHYIIAQFKCMSYHGIMYQIKSYGKEYKIISKYIWYYSKLYYYVFDCIKSTQLCCIISNYTVVSLILCHIILNHVMSCYT